MPSVSARPPGGSARQARPGPATSSLASGTVTPQGLRYGAFPRAVASPPRHRHRATGRRHLATGPQGAAARRGVASAEAGRAVLAHDKHLLKVL